MKTQREGVDQGIVNLYHHFSRGGMNDASGGRWRNAARRTKNVNVGIYVETEISLASFPVTARLAPALVGAPVVVDGADISGARSLRMPGVGFVRGVAAPSVEGVVESHPGFELGKVVGIHA